MVANFLFWQTRHFFSWLWSYNGDYCQEKSLGTDINQENWMLVIRLENSSSLKLFKQNCSTLQRQRSLTKGQLISKGLFKVLICTKKQTKIFFYFCPADLLFQNNTFIWHSWVFAANENSKKVLWKLTDL